MSTAKIGRNDPCVCGSGKKYKQCCLGKAEQTIQTADLPFPTVPEPFALNVIRAASTPFRTAYAAERPKIVGDIAWTTALAMPADIAAQALRLPGSGRPAMYLRRAPAAPVDELVIAHELLHLVLDAEGFPFVTSLAEHQPLAAQLNSLVQDPVIDARLVRYGFDVALKIRRDMKDALRTLTGAPPPLDRATRLLWIVAYAGQLLEARSVAPESTERQRDAFVRWFQAQHPTIAAEGDELLDAVQSVGYDTPERMRAFFAWIARRFHVAGDIVVSGAGQPAAT